MAGTKSDQLVAAVASGANTPGPWFPIEAESMKYCSVVEFEYGSGARGTVGLVGTDGVTVGASSLEEQNANARLIAAAPDLLAACQSMIPANVCLTNGNVPDSTIIPIDVTMGDFRKIAAAIAKATESPGASIAPPPAIPTPSARSSRPAGRQQDPDHAQ